MSKTIRHGCLTAEHAVRLALGAYYNAAGQTPDDGADLLGRWMLELSKKMQGDDVVGAHYAQIIDRWQEEDNLRNVVLENAQVATSGVHLDNALTRGLENG